MERQIDEIHRLGAEVVAISTDNIDSLRPWAEKLGISFPAAADFWPHGEVSGKYGVLLDYGVAARSMVLVDRDGKIRYMESYPDDVVPPVEPVLEALRSLPG